MEKMFYEERPLSYETIRSVGIMSTVIRFDVNQTADGWECEEVVYNHREPLTKEKDYGPMVSTLIRSRYSQDQVEAITQNYLADPEGHKEEFEALQSWRITAKNAATRIINI